MRTPVWTRSTSHDRCFGEAGRDGFGLARDIYTNVPI
jgi:hypothetical protein